MKTHVDILVIGGGPAGIAAAVEGVKAGLRTVLLDEQITLGGKVFSHADPWTADGDEKRLRPRLKAAVDLIRTGGLILPQTTVYSADEDRVVETYSPLEEARGHRRIAARAIVVAPGASDRLAPFPGWHLPGVFTIGGLNTLIKNGVRPGRDYVVAGTGVLLPALAFNILKAGGRVRAVIDAAPRFRYLDLGWSLFSQGFFGKALLGLRYLAALRMANVPYHYGKVVSRAEGDERVGRVTVRPLDGSGPEIQLESDVLAVSYGLKPQTRITQLMGCGHEYRRDFGYWQVHRNDYLESTVPNVFVAGDGGAVEGFRSAWEEGQLAGLTAAAHTGATLDDADQKRRRSLLVKSRRARRVGRAMARLSHPGPAPLELITDDTVVCRCEEVTFGQVKAAERDLPLMDINDLKRRLRLGMGSCQGQTCGQYINELLRLAGGRSGPVEQISVRPPLSVVPIGRLAE